MGLIFRAYTYKVLRSSRCITKLNRVDLTNTRATGYATAQDNQVFIALPKRQIKEWGTFSTGCRRVQAETLLSRGTSVLIQLDWSDKFTVLKCFPLLLLCCGSTAEEVSLVSSLYRLQLTNCIWIFKVEYICHGQTVLMAASHRNSVLFTEMSATLS